MKYGVKRSSAMAARAVQEGSATWWDDNTMSYDWKGESGLREFTPDWFDDIDQRFLRAARLFTGASNPFEELMDVQQLAGRRVLEIGCGMGFHAEMLVRAGANLSAVDLSETSVTATTRRLEQKQLTTDVRRMDAERLDFPAESFDMVWSWGVIHHSSRTGRIVREIARVLRPGGEARIMVYHLEGMPAFITLATRYLLGFWRGQSLDELLWRSTDGFSARFYTKDSLTDLLATFFNDVDVTVLGQDADVVPLPQALRRHALKWVSASRQRAVVRRRGAFLFAVAKNAR